MKKGRRPARKSHRHKKRFKTLQEAEAKIAEMDGEVALRFSPMNAYKCRFCVHYHIGHSKGIQAKVSTILVKSSREKYADT